MANQYLIPFPVEGSSQPVAGRAEDQLVDLVAVIEGSGLSAAHLTFRSGCLVFHHQLSMTAAAPQAEAVPPTRPPKGC